MSVPTTSSPSVAPAGTSTSTIRSRFDRMDATSRWAALAGLVLMAIAIPALTLGPGNDLDVGNVFRSGRFIALHLSYTPSRAPGSPVHEAAIGVLDRLGGPFLTNLGSLVMAAVLCVALFKLLRREGVNRWGLLAVALVALNPWFIIAATSTADFVWALAFVLLAANAVRSERPVLAGILGALSMGCRIGSGLLVLAFLFAELSEGRDARRRALTTAATTIVASFIIFIPPILATGKQFAANDFRDPGVIILAGRSLAKDILLLGPLASLLVLLAVPAVVRAISRWHTSWLVRFAVPGFVLSQLLFLRFPWKMAHLLPCLICGAILLGVALDSKPRLLALIVVVQLLYGVVRVDVFRPNVPNHATGGRVGVSAGWGAVVRDLQCRHRDPDAYLGKQIPTIQDAWVCAKPFGG